MLIDADDYVRYMARRGLFREDAPAPEADPRVWSIFMHLHGSHAGPLADQPIVLTPGGLGFYRDPLAGSDAFGWALLGAISHPWLPFSVADLLALADEILPTFARDGLDVPTICTDTFDLPGPLAPEHAPGLVWLRSPRARFGGGFADYLASLSADRRKAARHLLARLDALPGLRLDLSSRPPDLRELEFLTDHLTRRWGSDASYALVQSLWPLAVAAVRPAQALFMRAHLQDCLILFAGYILRGDVIFSQSTCRDLDRCPDGLGVAVDLKVIQALAGGPVRHLDPTCRTGLDDPPAIEVAKRKVVNDDACKPLLLAGALGPERTDRLPHLAPTGAWVLRDAAVILGRPA